MVPDTMSEAQAVDSMTHAMLSSSLLLAFSHVVFSERRDDLTVGQFFDAFAVVINNVGRDLRAFIVDDGIQASALRFVILTHERGKFVHLLAA